MNSVHIMGRITKDLELRYASNGEMAILSFNVAVNRKFVKQGEERQADFISCKAFSKTAENINKFFSKGSLIAIDGHIQTGSYDNKEGQKVYTTDVIVDGFHFTGEKRDGQASQNTTQSSGFFPIDGEESEDTLPF